MASSSKKVLLRSLQGEIQAGYLPAQGFVRLRPGLRSSPGGVELRPGPGSGLRSDPEACVDLLDLEGRVTLAPLAPLKWIAWVRDWNRSDPADPERLTRRTFLARPRSEGLWVRVTFAGGETLEGLAGLDLALLDGILEDRGLFLTPPDIRSNTQKLFVPRSAMTAVELLAVVTTPSKKASPPLRVNPSGRLFPEP